METLGKTKKNLSGWAAFVFEPETFHIRGVNRSIVNMGVVCQVQFCSKLFSNKFHVPVPFVA
jgi:hypothetical protein